MSVMCYVNFASSAHWTHKFYNVMGVNCDEYEHILRFYVYEIGLATSVKAIYNPLRLIGDVAKW